MSSSKDVREVKVKEPIRETREVIVKEEKRRRTIKTSGDGDTREIKRVKGETKVQKPAVLSEEEEVDTRSPEKDLLMYKAACVEVANAMANVKKLKDQGKHDSDEMEEQRIHGSLQFVTLKRLNRLGHIRCKKIRDATQEAKLKIDHQHLQLQNLLYEVMHLEKEINKCLEFKSKHEDIDLVDVSEFYQQAPPDITQPDITKKDLHKQTIARLDWEQEQRKRLSSQLKVTQEKKEVISKEIKTKNDYLESLQPKLNTILQATKPVQEYLEMPFDEMREQHRAAQYLPRPLYVLYVQSTAYKDACDKRLSVTITGDADVAKGMEGTTIDMVDDSESDQEEQEKKTSKRRRKTGGDRINERREKMLRPHPLSVVLEITCSGGVTLTLTFNYLLLLKVITVKVMLDTGSSDSSSSISGGDLLSADNLLSCLYPDDTGSDSPNPANQYGLSKLGVDTFGALSNATGHAYKWAQQLAGLEFVRITDRMEPQASVSSSYMEDTLRRLRQRVKARMSLKQQLLHLEQCNVPVQSKYQHLFPTKINSKLVGWKKSTYTDFENDPRCSHVRDMGLAKPEDLYFIASIERGSAKVHAHIVVHTDYPLCSPVFVVVIQWHGERTSQNDDSVREMEAELNLYCDELLQGESADQLLTNQMQRLLMCVDVYLEAEASTDEATEFQKEKIFPRTTRGPARGKPFKFNPRLGFFSHR